MFLYIFDESIKLTYLFILLSPLLIHVGSLFSNNSLLCMFHHNGAFNTMEDEHNWLQRITLLHIKIVASPQNAHLVARDAHRIHQILSPITQWKTEHNYLRSITLLRTKDSCFTMCIYFGVKAGMPVIPLPRMRA